MRAALLNWFTLGSPSSAGIVQVRGVGDVHVTQSNIDQAARMGRGSNPQAELFDITTRRDREPQYGIDKLIPQRDFLLPNPDQYPAPKQVADDLTLEQYARASHNRATLALVFTDIVKSTDLGNRLRDDVWLSILMQHFTRARTLIAKHNGYLIKFIGDACMVVFLTTIDAFRFTIELMEDTGHPWISIRAGLHFGGLLVVADDLFGPQVNLTSRIQSMVPGFGLAMSEGAYNDLRPAIGPQATNMRFAAITQTPKNFPHIRVIQFRSKPIVEMESKRIQARTAAGLEVPLQAPAK